MKFVIIFLMIILIIGLIKIRFKVLYNKEMGLDIVVRVLFLKIKLFSTKKSKKKELKDADNKIKKMEKKEKKKKKKKEKKNVFQTINFIKILILPLPKLLKFLIRGFKITKLKLNISISKEYAEKTALEYAKISSLVYNLFCLIKRYVKIKNDEIIIKPNFLDDFSQYDCLLKLNVRISRIFIGVCIYFFNVLLEIFSKNLFKKS